MKVFDFDKAIDDNGVCKRQKVKCENCCVGKLIYMAGLKARQNDLCFHKIVYSVVKVLREKSN
jgi:hypothetical protein